MIFLPGRFEDLIPTNYLKLGHFSKSLQFIKNEGGKDLRSNKSDSNVQRSGFGKFSPGYFSPYREARPMQEDISSCQHLRNEKENIR